MPVQEHQYNDLAFAVPVLEAEGSSFAARPGGRIALPSNGRRTWEYRLMSEGSAPLSVGTIPRDQRSGFSLAGALRVLDMPIRFPKTARLPAAMERFRAFVEAASSHAHATNPNIDLHHAYLTVDQGTTAAGNSQRRGGAHVDGFQGARIATKVLPDFSYVASDATPTRYHPGPFRLQHLDYAKTNVFHELDRQIGGRDGVGFNAYDIVAFDAYAVHEAARSRRDEHRTFVRLSYSVREFDRLGNTHNPMFRYTWDMVPRSFQQTLDNAIPKAERRTACTTT